MSIAWLRTPDGFKRAEILESSPAHRLLKVGGKEVAIPGENVPRESFFPALYEGAAEPEVWEFEGRSLPKVKPEQFGNPEQARALVPEVEPYHFPRLETVCILDGIIGGDHMLLFGGTGTGKTSRVLQIAARIGQPVVRVNFNAQVSPSDLLGFMGIGAQGTVWHDGLLTTAMQEGYWILLDELDFCPPDVASVLFPVLEKVSRVVLKEHPAGKVVTGERLKPWTEARKTGFRVFATGNSFGGESNGYHGTQQQNKALLNRFTGHGRVVQIAGMSPRDEKAMLRERCPWLPDKLIRRAVKFAQKVRSADAQNAAILPDFSTRELLNWCEKTVQYRSPVLAASMTFLPLVEDESTRAALHDAVLAIVGRRLVLNGGGNADPRPPRAPADPNARGSAAVLDPSNPKREAEFLAVLDARAKGLSWKAIEDLPALKLARRNGMTAWEIFHRAPSDLSAKHADRIASARKPAR